MPFLLLDYLSTPHLAQEAVGVIHHFFIFHRYTYLLKIIPQIKKNIFMEKNKESTYTSVFKKCLPVASSWKQQEK